MIAFAVICILAKMHLVRGHKCILKNRLSKFVIKRQTSANCVHYICNIVVLGNKRYAA